MIQTVDVCIRVKHLRAMTIRMILTCQPPRPPSNQYLCHYYHRHYSIYQCKSYSCHPNSKLPHSDPPQVSNTNPTHAFVHALFISVPQTFNLCVCVMCVCICLFVSLSRCLLPSTSCETNRIVNTIMLLHTYSDVLCASAFE